MTKPAGKHQPKEKSKKLKLKKETVKDLDPKNSSRVKGGAAGLSDRIGVTSCGFVRHCG
jgi:hypothetical protein